MTEAGGVQFTFVLQVSVSGRPAGDLGARDFLKPHRGCHTSMEAPPVPWCPGRWPWGRHRDADGRQRSEPPAADRLHLLLSHCSLMLGEQGGATCVHANWPRTPLHTCLTQCFADSAMTARKAAKPVLAQ